MGCDIHLLVETRYTYKGEKSEWERALPPAAYRETPWQVERGEASYDTLDDYAAVSWATRWYDGRNYRLFAMLANVRNGSGFAGVQTGEGFKPISEPKGWPSDLGYFARSWVSEDHAQVDGDAFCGDHSASWLTLRELDAYDWARQTTRCCGVIPLAVYAERKAKGLTGEPDAYCGGTWGDKIVTLEEADVDAAMANGGLVRPEGERTNVRVWWGMTYAEAAGDFYTRVLPGLRSLVQDRGGFVTTPDDIRIVFNFDS